MPSAPPIDAPPFLEHWFLINPWPAAAVLVCLGVMIRLIGQRLEQPALRWAGPVGVLLAVLVAVLGSLVVTQREQVVRVTRAFLHATVGDTPGSANDYVDTQAILAKPDGSPWVSHQQLTRQLTAAQRQYPFASQWVKDLAVQPRDERTAIAYLSVRTGFVDNAAPPAHTTWLLTWERAAEGEAWLLTEARWLTWAGREPSAIPW